MLCLERPKKQKPGIGHQTAIAAADDTAQMLCHLSMVYTLHPYTCLSKQAMYIPHPAGQSDVTTRPSMRLSSTSAFQKQLCDIATTLPRSVQCLDLQKD